MSVPACRAAVALLTLALLPACSIKHFAVNALGNALAEGGSSYARDADPDLVRATELRTRARRLYLRALGYGWRGLEVDFPGLRERLHTEGAPALSRTRKEHVPLLYFTGLAWFDAISVSKDDSELNADHGQTT